MRSQNRPALALAALAALGLLIAAVGAPAPGDASPQESGAIDAIPALAAPPASPFDFPAGLSSSAPGSAGASPARATAYVDGISDQNLQSWDPYFAAFFRKNWTAAGHVRISRYAVQWNVLSGAYPNYLAKYEAWYAASAALGLIPEVAVTSYDGKVPQSSAEYRAEVERLLSLKPVRYLEAWNEPNNKPFLAPVTAAQFAAAALGACEASKCVVIAGDFLDSPNMVSYETSYAQVLQPTRIRNWGVHPYYAVKAQNESTVVNFKANLPAGANAIWFTEIGAYQCVHETPRGEAQQALDASWLVGHLMPAMAPAHVLYYEYLFGSPPPCSGTNADTALYLPGSDPNAPDAPRPAANYIFGGRGVPSAYTGAASAVSASGATLTASVYTGGVSDTRYHFEYGPTREYGSFSAEGDAGAASGAVPASIPIGRLSAGTKYHYRVVAWNAEGSSDDGPSAGADRTLRTPRPTP